MAGRTPKSRWWLLLLALLLFFSMVATLWMAGKGIVKSRHGVGCAPPLPTGRHPV